MQLSCFGSLVLSLVTWATSLPAQGDDAAAVRVALDRWTRAFLAGKIDVTDPRPLDKDAPPRVPPHLVAHSPQRLNELQVLEILLRAASEQSGTAAAEQVLRLAAVGLERKSAELAGAVIVRSAAEEALDDCATTEVHAFLLDTARRPSKTQDDTALRVAAVRALGGSGQAVFWPMLTSLLGDSNSQVRAAAARAASDLGNSRSIAQIAQALRQEREPALIQAIALSLRDLLEIAERDGQLDPLLYRDAIRAVVSALDNTTEWRVRADLVRFFERHRAPEAVPALIEVLAQTRAERKTSGDEASGARILQAEAHRTLKALTGGVLAANQVDLWRDLWATSKGTFKVVPRRRDALPENATVAGGFFGIPVLGQRVVFVIDRSGSMISPAPQPNDTVTGETGTPTRLDIACRECWNAVKGMGADTYFNVVVFSDGAQAWKPELVPATTANKGALRNFLARLLANGSTNLWDGLSSAMQMRTAVGKSDYREAVDEIFLLSDGHPSSGEVMDSEGIKMRIAEQNRHTGIRLNTVFIGSRPSELDRLAQPGGGPLLQALAAQNNGTFVER